MTPSPDSPTSTVGQPGTPAQPNGITVPKVSPSVAPTAVGTIRAVQSSVTMPSGATAHPSLSVQQPSSIAAGVNAAVGAKMTVPKGIVGFNTKGLESGFLHCLLYGETDSRKTTTAAEFGGPERTLIILTRAQEQMLPLKNQGYRVAQITDGAALSWALQFPDQLARHIGFPEWADRLASPDGNAVLQIDDMTEGANQLVDENETTDDGRERKDGRQVYKAVNDNLRDLLISLKNRRMHTIFTALAKKYETPVANEEAMGPDLPTGARLLLTAELEYVLFMDKSSFYGGGQGKFITTPQYLQYKKKDDKGKEQIYKRELFAKIKLPKELAMRMPPVLQPKEPMNLAQLWAKVQAAKQETK